jgi:RNA polymerase sigma-70 factor (ECF subfamily)
MQAQLMTMDNQTTNRDFFQAAVPPLLDKLYGAAFKLTRNEQEAEELVAHTLELAWRRIDSLKDQKAFKSWIMHILSNEFISKWRKQKVHEKYFDEETYDELDETNCLYAKLHQPFLLWWSSPEQQFVNNLLREDIEKAIDGIPETYREVVILIEILEHNYKEVSDMLHIPVGTVRSRLNRGRRYLQDALYTCAKNAGLNMQKTSEVKDD